MRFHTMDGVKAMVLYGICLLICFIQGWTYTTNLSAWILNNLQTVFPFVLLIIGIVFIVGSKEKICTVGLTRIKLVPSLLWGILLAVCFVTGMAIYFRVVEHVSVGIVYPGFSMLGIFVIGAIQEEIMFRGYIRTRLTGMIKQPVICSFCVALLFLAMHYPTHWVAAGFSLRILSLYYVVSLIILHFVCDFVYKRTNCLWGAITLHFLYNAGQSMLVV